MFDEQRKHLIALLSYVLTKGGLGPGPGPGAGTKSGTGLAPGSAAGAKAGTGPGLGSDFSQLNPFALPSSSLENNSEQEDHQSPSKSPSAQGQGLETKTAREPRLGLLARMKGLFSSNSSSQLRQFSQTQLAYHAHSIQSDPLWTDRTCPVFLDHVIDRRPLALALAGNTQVQGLAPVTRASTCHKDKG